jgi:hypothetical protein
MEIIRKTGCIIAMIGFIFNGFQSAVSQNNGSEVIRTNMDGSGQKIVLTVTIGKEHNYPMMAAWVEDMDGNFVQTIYVNESVATGFFKYAVKNGGEWEPGEAVRPASLPVWAHSRGVDSGDGHFMPTKENPVPDAYTSATPLADFAVYSRSDKPLKGKYKVFFEINQSWDWNDYWTNGKFPDDPEYKTSSQPSVVYAAEIDLDNPQEIYVMKPVGHGHYSGKDGRIYSDLETITTALEIVESVTVSISSQGE